MFKRYINGKLAQNKSKILLPDVAVRARREKISRLNSAKSKSICCFASNTSHESGINFMTKTNSYNFDTVLSHLYSHILWHL